MSTKCLSLFVGNVVFDFVFQKLVLAKCYFFPQVDLESEREVHTSDGAALANEWGCPFFETSAKSKQNVDELFAEIVRETNFMSQPRKGDGCCAIL